MGIHDGHRANMRKRFLKSGLESFAEHEALELLLYYAIPRQDTNPIAHALVDRYGSLDAVLSAPVEDLQRVKGIGESAAILIKLVQELSAKARMEALQRALFQEPLTSTARVGSFLVELFRGEVNETVYQLCLDHRGQLLAIKRLSVGDTTSAEVDIRKVVENVFLTSASVVILAHNHPSGVTQPSQDDYNITERIRSSLEDIRVILADHVIVAGERYFSFADSGFIR